jgi:hypothetical protein
MNAIFQMFLHLYLHIKEFIFPPKNLCSHCKEVPIAYSVTDGSEVIVLTSPTLIKSRGNTIGFAADLSPTSIGVGSEGHSEQKHFFATTLIFKRDCLDALFLNGLAIAESQKLPFDVELDDETHSVYLVHAADPIYVKNDNAEYVRLNNATMETEQS